MEFEYDPEKSAADRAEHGIDFAEAQSPWSDPFLLEVPAPTEDEPRYLAVGRIGPKHWTAVFTRREGRPRIISMRRARRKEIEYCEGP
jgi:uncharacterized protein